MTYEDKEKDLFVVQWAEILSHSSVSHPFQLPALRIFLLGARGSGKSTHGEWLAQQLGLFHIQFRELLQMLIIAKTKKRVPFADELVSLEDDSNDLEAQIKEAREEHENETEDNSDNVKDIEVSFRDIFFLDSSQCFVVLLIFSENTLLLNYNAFR